MRNIETLAAFVGLTVDQLTFTGRRDFPALGVSLDAIPNEGFRKFTRYRVTLVKAHNVFRIGVVERQSRSRHADAEGWAMLATRPDDMLRALRDHVANIAGVMADKSALQDITDADELAKQFPEAQVSDAATVRVFLTGQRWVEPAPRAPRIKGYTLYRIGDDAAVATLTFPITQKAWRAAIAACAAGRERSAEVIADTLPDALRGQWDAAIASGGDTAEFGVPDCGADGLFMPVYCTDCYTWHANWVGDCYAVHEGVPVLIEWCCDADGDWDYTTVGPLDEIDLDARERDTRVQAQAQMQAYAEHVAEEGDDPLGRFSTGQRVTVENRWTAQLRGNTLVSVTRDGEPLDPQHLTEQERALFDAQPCLTGELRVSDAVADAIEAAQGKPLSTSYQADRPETDTRAEAIQGARRYLARQADKAASRNGGSPQT